MSSESKRLALLQIHIAVLLAGGTGLFGKLLPISPTVITCGRTLVGSLALGAIAFLLKADLRLRSPKTFGPLALSGALLALHWLTFFHSIQVSTVAIGLLALATFPLMVTLLEPFFFGEKLLRRDVAMTLLVTAGLVLVTPSFDLDNRLTRGLLWGLLSALACALVSLLSRSACRVYPALTVGFYQQAITALVTLPLALRWQGALTQRDVLLLVLLGLVCTALLQFLILASLRHLRAQTASIMFGLEPVYGIALAWMFLDETPGLRTLGGGLLICGAVLWTSLRHGEPAVVAEKIGGGA